MNCEVGSLVEGAVVDIVKYGAFVKIKGGKTGLLHVSRISEKFVRDINEYLPIGSKIIAKIILIDEKGRIQLSLRDITKKELDEFRPEFEESENYDSIPVHENRTTEEQPPRIENKNFSHKNEDDGFEKKLKQFLRQSEEKLVDLKRSAEGKRGGGKKKR